MPKTANPKCSPDPWCEDLKIICVLGGGQCWGSIEIYIQKQHYTGTQLLYIVGKKKNTFVECLTM